MEPADHYRALQPMEKEAFGVLARAASALWRPATALASRLWHPAATAAARTLPTAAKAPGWFGKMNNALNVGPANVASYVGKKIGGNFGAGLERAGTWGSSKF